MILKKILIRLTNIFFYILVILDRITNSIWYNNPFGNKPIGSEEDYLKLADKAKNQNYSEVKFYEDNKGVAIDKFWLDNLALYTKITIKKSELCYAHGRILYTTLSNYLSKKSKKLCKEKIFILETGTAKGFSAICMAKALKDNNKDGLIVTFDVIPHNIKMFWNSISDIINGPQTRAQLLKNWKSLCQKYILFHQGYTRLELAKVQLERIHFAFLDGAHTYNDVMFEFNQIQNKQNSGDIIVYDDYCQKNFPGIVKAVDEICKNNNYNKEIIRSSSERAYVIATKN